MAQQMHSLGGSLAMGRIAVGSNADGRLEVFVVWNDNSIWHNWQTARNNGWSDWSPLGAEKFNPGTRLALGQNGDGRLELFAVGADDALWQNWQTAPNNGWSGWRRIGGPEPVQ